MIYIPSERETIWVSLRFPILSTFPRFGFSTGKTIHHQGKSTRVGMDEVFDDICQQRHFSGPIWFSVLGPVFYVHDSFFSIVILCSTFWYYWVIDWMSWEDMRILEVGLEISLLGLTKQSFPLLLPVYTQDPTSSLRCTKLIGILLLSGVRAKTKTNSLHFGFSGIENFMACFSLTPST